LYQLSTGAVMREVYDDKVYPDTPGVVFGKLTQELVPVVASVRLDIADSAETAVQISEIQERIRRRYQGIHPGAVIIALRYASAENLLDLDEGMNEVHPPQRFAQWRHNY
jgi:hypothetical protein